MRYTRARHGAAAIGFAALLAGCGQVDSLLVMDGGGASGTDKAKVAYNASRSPSQAGVSSSGLSKESNPVVFLESAAKFAEREREYDTAARHWAHLASLEPGNTGYVRNLAVSLRVLGRHEDAERVLLQALRDKPENMDLNEEMAKTLIASGRLRDGVVLIEKINTQPGIDKARSARLYSAMGVAYDRAENHTKAQSQYKRALKAEPYNAMALNNLGLSYAMDGQLDLAEKTLRQALVAPTASTQVRQNLAMVLSLKGGTDEARRLVSQDLPPSMVKKTVAYYGGIADQQDAWRDAAAQ